MSRPDPGQEFAEIWAEAVTSARHLRIFTLAFAAVTLVLLIIIARLVGAPAPKPIVIRVDEVGRAQALAYEAVEAQADPLAPTTKYFLNQFLTDYYSRRTATAEEAWSRALRFLSVDLANAAFRAESEGVAQVAAGVTAEERQVQAVVLRIHPQPEPPHAATADFDLVTLVRGAEQSRERWTVSLQFTFLETVPTALLPVNPMGVLVTYLQADRAQGFE